MLTRFSSNQPLIANAGLTTDITTDPVGVGDATQGSGVLTIHTFVGTGPSLEIYIESSNDGANWHTPSSPFLTVTTPPTGPIEMDPFAAHTAFVRVRYKLIGGSDQAYVIFDLNVRFYQP